MKGHSNLVKYALIGLVGAVLFLLAIVGIGWLFGARTIADFAAFGQFAVDVILMPTVVVTLLITLYQFRQLQATPDLDLYLRPIYPDDGKPIFLKEGELLKTESTNLNSPQEFYLINAGNKIALWYMVEIRVPEYLNPSLSVKIGTVTESFMAVKGEWTKETENGEYIVRFSSGGKYAVYPNYPLHLGSFGIQVPPNKKFDLEYEMTYMIANDWGSPAKGTFTLKLVEGEKRPRRK